MFYVLLNGYMDQGVGWSWWQLEDDPCCPTKFTFFDGGMVKPIATSPLAQFSTLIVFSSSFFLGKISYLFCWFLCCLHLPIFLCKYTIWSGWCRAMLLFSNVVASSSSSVDEDGTLMGTIVCTRIMPRGGAPWPNYLFDAGWDWCQVFKRMHFDTCGPVS